MYYSNMGEPFQTVKTFSVSSAKHFLSLLDRTGSSSPSQGKNAG